MASSLVIQEPSPMNVRAAVALTAIITAACLGGASMKPPPAPAAPPVPPPAPAAPAADGRGVLDFTMKRIDGAEENLAIYKGKVVVIVNVASKCGFTSQYRALQALYEKHKDSGLVILGFPANNFRGQEPGSNEEIAKFCSADFGVTFPMFEKISVKGEDQHPLYKRLIASPGNLGGDPKWNFTKFVIDRSGAVAARFDPKGDGGDRARLEAGLEAKVEELLKAKP